LLRTSFPLWLLVAAIPVTAQQRTGSLQVTVADRSGGTIPQATLLLQNEQTNWKREGSALGDGQFLFSFVPVGHYALTVSHPGFQRLKRTGIAVSVNETPTLQVVLDVEQSETTVVVAEAAAQVNVVNATNGGVIGQRQIVELPLNDRKYVQLGTLMPGVVETPARFQTQGLAPSRNGFAVNGMRTQSNNFLLDGVSNNDAFFNGYVVTPPPDSLAEFKIITSNFSAEYGNNAGSIVNVITRSGTNTVHASLWNFLRNDVFDARNFFSTTRPPLRRNQYGVAAGAPIRRDQTFVFGYWEGLREREGQVQNVPTLNPAQRNGELPGARDPLTGQPFPGGVLPPSRISPITRTLNDQFVPLPNAAGNRVLRQLTYPTNSDQFGLRGDHRFSDRNSLFLRYSHYRSDRLDPIGGSTFSPAGSRSLDAGHSAAIGNTHAFSPTLLNEFNVTFIRQHSNPATWSGQDLQSLGWRYSPTESSAKGLPAVSVTGLFSLGDVAQSYTYLARNTYQIYENLAWTRGRHNLRFGFDTRQNQLFLVFPNRPNGDFSVTGAFSGNAIGDYLLGRPSQFRQGGGDPAKHFYGWQNGLYFQDDWKLSRRLTLNLGLRYDLPVPYVDKQDRMASFQPGRKSTVRPSAPAGLLYPGDDGVPRGTIPTDHNNFAPRLGFAYDLMGDGRTSLRGGYGIFYDTVPGVAVFQNINVAPFNKFIQVDGNVDWVNPYSGFAVNPQTDPSRDFPCPCLVIGFSPDNRTPYAQHYNLSLQRQLSRNLVAEVGYVGSLGRKLAGYLEANPAVPGSGATLANTQQRRLHRDFNLVRPTYSRFNSNYDALQARIERRFAAGLGLQVSYTWSKAIDFQSSVNFGGETRPQNAFSLSDVRGLAAFHVAHRLVGNFVYELPYLRGWRLSGLISAQSGGPLTVNEPVDLSLRGLNADRPDLIRNPNHGLKTPQQWFDTAAFSRLNAAPGGQRSGTAGRNVVLGPGLVQSDLAVMKDLPLTDRGTLQLRVEGFNILNRTNFLNPLTNIGAPQTFGQIQQARAARILQLALKLSF
jgi:outer membrane receptor protein involved in Fe transport